MKSVGGGGGRVKRILFGVNRSLTSPVAAKRSMQTEPLSTVQSLIKMETML